MRLVTLLALLGVGSSYAVECNVTFIKDKCYANYEVHLSVLDSQSKQSLAELDIPSSQFWIRQSFDCHPGQVIAVSSTFTPAIWDADAGMKYPGTHFTQLPDVEPAAGTIWSMQVCFPAQFSKVPTPPKISGPCGCDIASIPPLKNPHIVTP